MQAVQESGEMADNLPNPLTQKAQEDPAGSGDNQIAKLIEVFAQ